MKAIVYGWGTEMGLDAVARRSLPLSFSLLIYPRNHGIRLTLLKPNRRITCSHMGAQTRIWLICQRTDYKETSICVECLWAICSSNNNLLPEAICSTVLLRHTSLCTPLPVSPAPTPHLSLFLQYPVFLSWFSSSPSRFTLSLLRAA